MGIEQALNIKFARFLENYPCLYDHKCKEYSNRNVTERAWSEVAEEFNLTVKECKAKWKNIRTVFRRHIFTNVSSVSGVTSKYYLNDVLQYLIPLMKPDKKSCVHNLPSPPRPIDDTDKDGDIEIPNLIMTEGNTETSDMEIYDADPIAENADIQGNFNPKVKEFKSVQLCKCQSTVSLDEVMTGSFREEVTNATSTMVKSSASLSDERFLLSLIEDMKEMNPTQKRKFKRKIFGLIEEILAEGSSGSHSHTKES